MNRGNKVVGLTLAAMMAVVTACGSGSTAQPGTGSTPAPAPASQDTYEVAMGFPILGNVPKDLAEVEAAINKISKEKINATVKLVGIPIGQWYQQRNLMLTSNEKLDLMLLDFQTYSGFVSKNQLTDMNELLDKQGKGIKDTLGPFLDAAKINGNIYATPTAKLTDSGTAILMRKDLLDKHGIDAGQIKSSNDLDAVFKTIKEKEPDVTVIAPTNGPMPMVGLVDSLNVDTLADTLGVLPNYDNGMKIVNMYEMPEYLTAIKKMRSWFTAGYLPKDSSVNKISPHDLIKSGKAFSFLEGDSAVVESKYSTQLGVPLVKVTLQKPVWTTQNVLGLMWGIPRNNTKNAAKAMEFLALTYTNKDIVNLINFGIEGKHYTKKSDTIIAPTAGDNGYTLRQSFMFGNERLTYILEGMDPAVRDKDKAMADSMAKSKALGFLPDLEPVKTEVIAVNNVVEQYKKSLETGSVDPDKVLPEFIAKLKSAGIDKVIAEKQKQLDAWVAGQKK